MTTLFCTSDPVTAPPARLPSATSCRGTVGKWWHALRRRLGPRREHGFLPPADQYELTALGELFLGCSGDGIGEASLALQPIVRDV